MNDTTHTTTDTRTVRIYHATGRTYDHVGTETVDNYPLGDVLARVFRSWNAGPESSDAYRRADVRSLSVGDVVTVDNTAHEVTATGFNPIDFNAGSDE